jgi:hypothetical protein
MYQDTCDPFPNSKTKRVLDFLEDIQDPRREAILQFHENHISEISTSWGSKLKHQAWPGGYLDHLAEIFRIAESMYEGLCKQRNLPFCLSSAIVVLYFHDVEKIWKYTTGIPDWFDKYKYLFETLAEEYEINFTPEEVNALKYIHGESEADYNPDTRIMGPLAAFCHCADTLSARLWFDEGKGLG